MESLHIKSMLCPGLNIKEVIHQEEEQRRSRRIIRDSFEKCSSTFRDTPFVTISPEPLLPNHEATSLLPLTAEPLEVLYVISPALRHVVNCKFFFVGRRWLYGEKLRFNSQSAGKISRLTITSESNQI